MNSIKFEDTLGKPLTAVESTIGFYFKEYVSKDNQINFYRNDQDISLDYFGLISRFITIQSNNENVIKSISIHFREIINRKFYEKFKKIYGDPDNIHVVTTRNVVSEEKYEKDDFVSKVRKSELDFREGTFEEKPLFIIWIKEDYQIKILLRHKQNFSEITFRACLNTIHNNYGILLRII